MIHAYAFRTHYAIGDVFHHIDKWIQVIKEHKSALTIIADHVFVHGILPYHLQLKQHGVHCTPGVWLPVVSEDRRHVAKALVLPITHTGWRSIIKLSNKIIQELHLHAYSVTNLYHPQKAIRYSKLVSQCHIPKHCVLACIYDINRTKDAMIQQGIDTHNLSSNWNVVDVQNIKGEIDTSHFPQNQIPKNSPTHAPPGEDVIMGRPPTPAPSQTPKILSTHDAFCISYAVPSKYKPKRAYINETITRKRVNDKLELILKKFSDDAQKKIYLTRIHSEMNIISKFDLWYFFGVAGSIVAWAEAKGIVIGHGRGSACCSLVCYVLGITSVDPIKYNLSYERFLNADRLSTTPPDIDIDIESPRRHEMEQYLFQLIGNQHVCRISSYAKHTSHSIEKIVGNDKDNRVVQALLGIPKSRHRHASAITFLPPHLNIYEELPCNSQQQQCLYDSKTLSHMYTFKIDLLSSHYCSKVQIFQNQYPNEGKKCSQIPMLNEVMEMFSQGQTQGIPLFETQGMTEFVKRCQPKTLIDLATVLALYRPATLRSGATEEYLKNQASFPQDISDSLNDILRDTRGVIVFQEQVSAIGMIIGGLSSLEGDRLREEIRRFAMGHEGIHYSILKDKFLKGAERTLSPAQAKQVWDQLSTFGAYGFNKGHAIAYAMNAYYLQYTHYIRSTRAPDATGRLL